MRILVLGATGRTGAHVVRQALHRGLAVTAVARHPKAVPVVHPALTVLRGDVLDPPSLTPAMNGADAVVSALGTRSRGQTRLYSDGISAVLAAMGAAGVRRLVAVTAQPVGDWSDEPAVRRRLVLPLLERAFGAAYADMRRMETILRASDVDWTVLRPPYLTDRPGTGSYRLAVDGRLPRANRITCADLASALLDVLNREDSVRRACAVAS